jgi:hypothetical protein
MDEKKSQLESKSHSYFSKFGSIDSDFFGVRVTAAETAILLDVAQLEPLIHNADNLIDLIKSLLKKIRKAITGKDLLRTRTKPLKEIKANYSVCEYI